MTYIGVEKAIIFIVLRVTKALVWLSVCVEALEVKGVLSPEEGIKLRGLTWLVHFILPLWQKATIFTFSVEYL